MIYSMLMALSLMPIDTLVVEQACMEEPVVIQKPLVVDSLNMQGGTLAMDEVLKQNVGMLRKSNVRKVDGDTIYYGAALKLREDSLPTLRLLRFTIDTQKFIEGRFDIKKLNNYKLFVGEEECTDKKFRLSPGRTDVTLQVLTQSEHADSFNVRLIGEHIKQSATINSTAKRAYTMEDMMLGDHYRSVSLSPSGRYLVTIRYFVKTDGATQYKTELSEVTSGRVLMNRNEYVELNWLPRVDKDVLYFTRNGGLGRELVEYTPADGRENVLADNLPNGGFRVAPNASYLIFNKTDEGKNNSNGLKRLLAPDDRMGGWRNRNQLWKYDLKSGAMQRLSFGKRSVYLADISADSQQLLLQYNSFDPTKKPFSRTSILRMDVLTGKIDTLLADTAFVSTAKFSPDAKQILIQASPSAFDGIGSELPDGITPNAFDYRLFVYTIASKEVMPLLCGFKPSVDSYQWSKGDDKVYFLAADGTDKHLFCLDVLRKQVRKIPLPVSYVQGYSLSMSSRNPRLVCFGQTGERARELFMATLDKVTPKFVKIGAIDFDKLYADVAIGKSVDWKFKSTRGDSISGYYILPPNFDATKQYPMIVYYYGGCTPTSKCLEFQYPLQVLSGQGYVIYVVNPSGAIGYGQEYASRHVNTWGKESGDDIIEGVKAFCDAHRFVDAKHIGCMGASYGGFMTEYLQTRTDIFATAISHAGISNIASYWGGGYWGYTYGEVAQYGSYPWNNPNLYVEQSPLFNADKIHTPLLLLHGTADTNVPTTESQQLFTALKILGRDVCYVQIDGENHVITNHKKRLAWQNVIFAWFSKYLQEDDSWWKSIGL